MGLKITSMLEIHVKALVIILHDQFKMHRPRLSGSSISPETLTRKQRRQI